MANNPKKITDPTEAALSAIQEALSTRDSAAEPVDPPVATATAFARYSLLGLTEPRERVNCRAT